MDEEKKNILFLGLWVLCKCLPEVIFAQGEEVAVTHAPDIGCPPVSGFVARDVEDADFSKHRSFSKSYIDLPAIVSDHVQLASLDDVHLFTDISLAAHVVTRRKYL